MTGITIGSTGRKKSAACFSGFGGIVKIIWRWLRSFHFFCAHEPSPLTAKEDKNDFNNLSM